MGRRGRGVRAVGVWFWMLYLVGAAGALVLVWRSESEVAKTAAALLLALPTAYLGLQAFRHDRAEAAREIDLGAVADQLADVVRGQAEEEAALRRVEDPYPLPVAWRAADGHLVERWDTLTAIARAWPGGPPGDPADWPADAAGLSGAGAEIGEIYALRVPTRRLIVLGEPGSGKSVLLLRLVQDQIERRQPGDPVPVVLSMASWDPTQPLAEWGAQQLRLSYPALTESAPGIIARDGRDLAQALWNERLVLPFLDGFDELPPALQPVALDALNRGLPAKHPVVLAGRAAEFEAALTQAQARIINGAAGIHLLPIDHDEAAAYLRRDAGGHTPADTRWDRVAAQLGTATPVGQALATPLGLFLARTIYNSRHGTGSPAPHPDALCDTTAYPTHSALNDHLFSAFIPAAYTTDTTEQPRWTAAQAEHAFVFLAHHLHTHHNGSPDLAWWELRRSVPAPLHDLAVGLTVGLTIMLTITLTLGAELGDEHETELLARLLAGLGAGLGDGLWVGLWAGLTVGLAVGFVRLATVHQNRSPSTGPRWSSSRTELGGRIALGIVFGLTLGIADEVTDGIVDELPIGILGGLTLGIALGLMGGLLDGVEGEAADLTTAVTPSAVWTQDRRVFLTFFLGVGPMLMAILWTAVAVGLAQGIGSVIPLGTGAGLGLGLALGISHSTWPDLVVTRAYLVLMGHLPWSLKAFLEEAHARGVLRQTGAMYQFRHIDLQRHLALRP